MTNGEVTAKQIDQAMTREQVTHALVQYAEWRGAAMTKPEVNIPDIDSVSPQYREAVQKAYRYGITNGKDAPNGFYYFDITPEALSLDHKYITRANGKITMQNGVISNADTSSTPAQSSASASPTKFTDVSASSPFVDAINWAVEKNITTGKTDTTFAAGEECTNGQILTFLWRASGSPEPTIANPFTDSIPASFQKAAVWAYEKGLVSDAAFGASTPCTRAVTVEYLWKAAGSPAVSGNASFTDVPANADYAQAVAWAVSKGITGGTSANTFSPSNVCTRGQIVTFLYRAFA